MLYPLSILKDLSALKSVSLFGIAGHLTAMGALAARVADKSYLPGGAFAPAAAAAAQAKAKAAAAAVAGGSSASKVRLVAVCCVAVCAVNDGWAGLRCGLD